FPKHKVGDFRFIHVHWCAFFGRFSSAPKTGAYKKSLRFTRVFRPRRRPELQLAGRPLSSAVHRRLPTAEYRFSAAWRTEHGGTAMLNSHHAGTSRRPR